MTKLSTLRATQKQLRKTFEQQKQAEWDELSAEVEARITAEINKLYREGLSVAQIMRQYGTSDYRTVKNRVLDLNPMTVVSVSESGLEWRQVKDTTWGVTDGTHTAQVVVLEDEGVTVLVSSTDKEFGELVNMEGGYGLWLQRTTGN